MEEYTSFAKVYDEFMDNTPYDAWAARIVRLIRKFGISRPERGQTEDASDDAAERDLVVDLGCGTGRMAERLSDAGFDVLGIDLSEDMLAIAQEREMAAGRGIHYLQQDMRDFELYGCAGTFVSVCDSINYLLTVEDLVRCFRQVRLQLLPGGIFIFDFNTVHKYKDVIGDRTIAEDRDDAAFIWDNEFLEEVSAADLSLEEDASGEETEKAAGTGEETSGEDTGGALTGETEERTAAPLMLHHINVYHVSFFLPESGAEEDEAGDRENAADEDPDGALYRRYEELHYQRGYTLEEMKDAAARAGLAFVTAMDSDTDGPVTEDAQRVLVVLRQGLPEEGGRGSKELSEE